MRQPRRKVKVQQAPRSTSICPPPSSGEAMKRNPYPPDENRPDKHTHTHTHPAPGVRGHGVRRTSSRSCRWPSLRTRTNCPRAVLSGLTHAVLSIGKLSAGQARYYLEQGEVRVDAVESIGDGLEEYYAGGAEARGSWVGSGGMSLGLHGPVDGEALRRVLAGSDPLDGSPLRGSSSAVKVAGFDLTFSAPKSVSVVFGIGDRELRTKVRAAHDRAVVEAVGYLERSAAAVRRGHGGARVEPAAGLVAAAFRHRTSRAGDPQLHTHVLVANLGRGPDGRWSALDGRQLYAHARAASFLYQAVLRAELTRTLGLEWLPVHNGIADLVGVPKPVLKAFSQRRAEIEASMAAHGDVWTARRGGGGAGNAAGQARRRQPRRVDRGLAGPRCRARPRPRSARAAARSRPHAGTRRFGVAAGLRRARLTDRSHPPGVHLHASRCPPGDLRADPGWRDRGRACDRGGHRSVSRLAARRRAAACAHGR